MKVIILSFRDNPCFCDYKNFNNLIKYFNRPKNSVEDKRQNIETENEMDLKIRKIRELKYITKVYQENREKMVNKKIKSICIQTQNFYNLNIFKTNENAFFEKLEILDLKNNNISNIKVLSEIIFPELKYLSFSTNRLSDDSIEIIHKLYKTMPKLFLLNLSRNAFTRHELLKGWENFKNLKQLFIGINRIHPDLEKMENNDEIYDFSNINELGLSTGIFSEKSINLIKISN